MKVSEGDAKVPHSQITNFVVIKVFPVNVVLMRRCWTNSSPFACHSEAVTILLQSHVPGCFASTLNFHFTFQSVCPKHVDSMPLAQGPCQVLSLSQFCSSWDWGIVLQPRSSTVCFPFLECPTFAFIVRVNLETVRHYFLALLLNDFTCWSRLSHWTWRSTKGKSVTYLFGFSQRNQDW